MIKLLTLLCLLLVTGSRATLFSTYQSDRSLELHDYYRERTTPKATNMPAFTYDAGLASTSNSWAQQCTWQHSGTPNVGENLYATTLRVSNPSNFDISSAINAWGAEGSDYNYSPNTCNPGKICGHYTQVIWASSNILGCALQDCPTIQGLPWSNGGTIVVCQYKPPGNWVGQHPYTEADWTTNWHVEFPGSWKQVSVKGSQLWALDTTGALFQRVGTTWVQRPGVFTSVGASPDGWAWATTSTGAIVRWNPGTTTWEFILPPTMASNVIFVAEQVDAISKDSAVMISDTNVPYRYSASTWTMLPGSVRWISIGYGNDLWCVQESTGGYIYRWVDSSGGWVRQAGSLGAKIHVTDLQNIGLVTTLNRLYRYTPGAWSQVTGTGPFMAMANGNMFAIMSDGNIYQSP